MSGKSLEDSASVKGSILSVLGRIRANPRSRRLLSSDFSLALNAVGESFVDFLLQKERTGNWWLADSGKWQECAIKSVGRRCHRNFLPGSSVDWGWFPATNKMRQIADGMTGPDHVVSVSIRTQHSPTNVVLEQKLRFGTNQNAVATAATYVSHLRHGLKGEDKKASAVPKSCEDVDENYFDKLLTATKRVLLKEKQDGILSHSGSVSQVCFVSIKTAPHKIFVCDKGYTNPITCDFVGFLAPTVDHSAMLKDSPARRIVEELKVRLWLGLDSLLDQCTSQEVEEAWCVAIDRLSESVRDPRWMKERT